MPSRKKIIVSRARMDYVHQMIKGSRHNETHACLMSVAGVIFFVGGILETVITIEDPDWFLFFPYKIATTYSQAAYACLGLFMALSGLVLLVVGISFAISYASDGKYYVNQLKEAYPPSHISARAHHKKKDKEKSLVELSEKKEVGSPGCPHHFGYLTNHLKNDIPDECLICQRILKCIANQNK